MTLNQILYFRWQQLGEWKQWQLPQFPQHSVLAV